MVVVLLAILVLAGCGETGEKVRGDEIMQKALAAQSGLASSYMEASLVATVEGTLFRSPLTVSLDGGKGSAEADWANRKMRAGTEVTVAYTGVPFPVRADLYVIDGYPDRTMAISGGADLTMAVTAAMVSSLPESRNGHSQGPGALSQDCLRAFRPETPCPE